MISKLVSSLAMAAAALVAVAFPAHAQAPAAPLTVEEIWKQPQLANPVISRDGKHMAATMPFKGRMNLAVIDLETRNVLALTGYDMFDVLDVIGSEMSRLLYSLGQVDSPTGPGQFDGGGLFMVSRDGKESRRISHDGAEIAGTGMQVYRSFSISSARFPATTRRSSPRAT